MTIKQNKAVVLAIMEAYNGNQSPDIVPRVISEKYREGDTYPLKPEFEKMPGVLRIPREVELVRNAFPDAQYTIRDLVAEGNTVILIWDFKGTHKGDFFGRPATGRQLQVTGFEVVKFDRNAQMIGHYSNHGQTGMETLARIGFLDPPALEKFGMPQLPR